MTLVAHKIEVEGGSGAYGLRVIADPAWTVSELTRVQEAIAGQPWAGVTHIEGDMMRGVPVSVHARLRTDQANLEGAGRRSFIAGVAALLATIDR